MTVSQPKNPSDSLPLYRRVVVKAGTNVLTGDADHLDQEMMASLVDQIAHLRQQGGEVILVTSGAVAAGRHVLKLAKERKDIPFRQVLASVGQSRLMGVYEELFGKHAITVAQALVTRGDLSDRLGYLNVRNTLLALLELRVVPVINENDVIAVEELGGEVFGDNDNLSAMVANLVDADLLVMLTDTQGLYTADPDVDPEATLVRRVERIDATIEALAGTHADPQSRGGMLTKLQAARLATASGVAVVIADGRQPGILARIVAGEEVGTLFTPTASKMESRKRWMLSDLSTRGEILVDQGAAEALRHHNSSLLPAGVQGVNGAFQRGDIVSITTPDGTRVACGITNYPSQDIEAIKGLRSDRIEAALGYQYGQEVVHRNNLVLL